MAYKIIFSIRNSFSCIEKFFCSAAHLILYCKKQLIQCEKPGRLPAEA
jgi:hypothetical protein